MYTHTETHTHTRIHTLPLISSSPSHSPLSQAGQFDLQVQQKGTGFTVKCKALGATIRVEGTQTRVEVDDADAHAAQEPTEAVDTIVTLASDLSSPHSTTATTTAGTTS